MYLQGEGALTYAGRKRSPTVYGHHDAGKYLLDMNLFKAERHLAVPLSYDGLLQRDNDTSPVRVTYKYRTYHSILRWLPSKGCRQNLWSGFLTT